MKNHDSKTQTQEMNSNLSDSEIDGDNHSGDVGHRDELPSGKPSFESSDEEIPQVTRVKKRVKRFSNSESDSDTDIQKNNKLSEIEIESNKNSSSDHNDSNNDLDSDDNKKSIKNKEQQIRMKNKRNKLRQKFKSLVTSRSKETSKVFPDSDQEKNQSNSEESMDDKTITNEEEINKSMQFKTSICDPDTSDEENINDVEEKLVSKSLHQKKSTKPTSPKPLRMSAKQAMENMHKIKSESNRLLREKEISLPYHRPKAFTLKDIMSRRKPAMTADGKALPIKMNEEQLKQYAHLLEQRQKEIMDLCKSESDEEQENGDAFDEQKQPLEISNNIMGSGLLPNNEDNPTLAQAAESNSVKEIPLREETKLTNTEDIYVQNIELDNSSNMDVDGQCSSDDNLIAVNNHSNKEIAESELDNSTNKDVSKENVAQQLHMTDKSAEDEKAKITTDPESQIVNLHYDTENTINDKLPEVNSDNNETVKKDEFEVFDNDSSDDIDMDYIDMLIENADVSKDNTKSSTLNTGAVPLDIKPKLTGAPGMVIDLDNDGSAKKISGVELLKERFSYFAKLKTPEELEREKEKRSKPGVQHQKLKQELENIIAEQRSLEWAKRLNEEKQHQMELKALRGEESDAEDIEKMEALIDDKDISHADTSDEGESEPEDDVGEIKEKPRKKHAMIDDEAEESDCDDEDIEEKQGDINEEENEVNDTINNQDDSAVEEPSSDESSDDESEDEEETTKAKKGRILKAFEDSDDETANEIEKKTGIIEASDQSNVKEKKLIDNNEPDDIVIKCDIGSQINKLSQDDEIQLAQRMNSASDIFGSQEGASVMLGTNSQGDDESAWGTQTFSILKSTNAKDDVLCNLENSQKLSFISDIQTLDSNQGAAAALCPGSFTQNLIPSNLSSSQQPIDQSQPIGEDVLALCTGNFYDNQFISQSEENKENELHEASNENLDDSWSKVDSQKEETDELIDRSNLKGNEQKDNGNIVDNNEIKDRDKAEGISKQKSEYPNLLQSIIDELDDDNIDSLKPNKYFVSKDTNNDVNDKFKKKFVIESDDELNVDVTEKKKKKKVKKKKLEQRALQISDDEEEDFDDEGYDLEEENDAERVVEYDSEENEIEVKQVPKLKKKRKVADFFENEAELTSEDEWVGSGDEDEAGLDRMEREEGDDETFHQGKLQRELGQIHMRDVLDQDKREVRLIQELLFEDGDLGGGSRQRKFRWRNADGEEEPDTTVDDFADTQEEEFESEEQWRKQRHERQTFLRQMEEQDKTDSPNVTISRTSIIKANLSSKPLSSLLLEVNDTTIKKTDNIENPIIKEKAVKDIPNPLNGFTILQQNYHSSLLTRGRGALARLAALATPLAVDEDSTKVAAVAPKNQRNFVFAAITKEDNIPKVTKRKADSKLDTPRLVKKLKINEKKTLTRNSLLDHLKI